MVPTVVGDKYRVGKRIGQGAFGDIHLGYNMVTAEEVAIKFEPIRTAHPQLIYESKLYRLLAGGIGIPHIRWYGIESDYNVLVIELLGPSLEDLFNVCHRRFSLKTVLMLADQMISRVQYVHARNFLHRDIKPDNFLMGTASRSNLVYLIDFGLAKKYRDHRGMHIPFRDHKSLTGTARYASLNTHNGIEQSRRDDLECLAYVLIYFLRGALPWQNIRATTKKEKYDKIADRKTHTRVEVLCRGYPVEFIIYLNYVRTLRFDDRPDYSYLRKLFRDLFNREGYHFDYLFDWSYLRTDGSRRHNSPGPNMSIEQTDQSQKKRHSTRVEQFLAELEKNKNSKNVDEKSKVDVTNDVANSSRIKKKDPKQQTQNAIENTRQMIRRMHNQTYSRDSRNTTG
eukprot:TRINITY_DN2848_c0_g1_i3.p1 TRINITY_DN2848_c0_g1~~TRINITY_DN2848_c0_g1_i3.p1  ORF type:complete len:397 (+),score=76.47 TRINITY_DN2848_c0_g1_i3:52-1242(+)